MIDKLGREPPPIKTKHKSPYSGDAQDTRHQRGSKASVSASIHKWYMLNTEGIIFQIRKTMSFIFLVLNTHTHTHRHKMR